MKAGRSREQRRLLRFKIGLRRRNVRAAHRALRFAERWQDRAYESLVDAEVEAL
jgi:hypothetical protein